MRRKGVTVELTNESNRERNTGERREGVRGTKGIKERKNKKKKELKLKELFRVEFQLAFTPEN
jgi:hypothetical protein